MNGNVKRWGETPPISTDFPTAKELALNEALIDELRAQNNFEAPQESKKRTEVLKKLQEVAEAFVKQVGRSKGLPQSLIDGAGGKIYTFGSYRLGVYGPGSDIDTLMVVPKHVSRDDFFAAFPDLLQSMSPKDAISELKPVTDAFVPIIKMEYQDISIDLICASLLMSSIPPSLDLKDNAVLRGLDEIDLRCVNGTRVTDEILSVVPEQKTFRHALRAIKLWAQRRAIYANVMGFPGGVAWAMMVARICQLYPHASGATVVDKFFNLLLTWPFPRPIALKPLVESQTGPLQNLYPGDNRHIMPVITPAYPPMCATHNISDSNKTIIMREIRRGKDVAGKIAAGQLVWKDLFKRHTFFSQDYKYYLSIVSGSKTKSAQSLWSGLVESKVRRLVGAIDNARALYRQNHTDEPPVALAHPFTKGFERVHHCRNDEEIDKVLQGSLAYQAPDTKTETTDAANDAVHQAVAEGSADSIVVPKEETEHKEVDGETVQTVYTTTYYVAIELAKDAKTLDISGPVSEFKAVCEGWKQYDAEVNSVRIIHTRNYDLPDDVFEPGEAKPTRAKKAKRRPDELSKKRSYAEASLEAADSEPKRHVSASGAPTPVAAG